MCSVNTRFVTPFGYEMEAVTSETMREIDRIAVTETGSDLFFDDAGTDWWSGESWWIPLIAAGGLAVAALRRWLAVPEEVPGAIAFAQQA